MKSSERQPLATVHPNRLRTDVRFWLHDHWRATAILIAFFASFLGLIATGIIPLTKLATLNLTAPQAWSLVIQIPIILIGSFAFWNAGQFLCRIAVEMAFAEHVASVGQSQIRAIRGQQRESIELDKVPEMWPQSPDRGLATLRMCEAIHSDAVDSQFGSKEAMLQYYREESFATLEAIGNQQRAAVHLGILGTFFGLVFAMPELVKLGGGDFDASAFTTLFSSLKVCFSTSIAGLVVAVFLNWQVTYLLRVQKVFFERLEEAASTMLVVVRNALNRTELAKTFDHLNNSIGNLTRKVTAQNERLQIQTEAITRGMEDLKSARENLDAFLTGVADIRNQLMTELDQAAKAMGQLKARFVQEIDATSERISNALAGSTTILDEQKELIELQRKSYEGVLESASTQFTNLGEKLAATLQKTTDAVSEHLATEVRRASEEHQKLERWKEQLLDQQKAAIEIHSDHIGRVVDRLAEGQSDFIKAQREILDKQHRSHEVVLRALHSDAALAVLRRERKNQSNGWWSGVVSRFRR